MVVYTTDDGRFRELAASIAERRDEPLVDELPSSPGERVVYVDAPDAVESATLLDLQTRLESFGPERGGFSVVTGYEPETADGLYGAPTPDGEDALLIQHPHSSFDVETSSDDAAVLLGDDVTVSQLEELVADGLRSLSIQTHGWPIHLNLSDGFVCGFPERRDVTAYGGRQPHCVEDGAKACPFDEDLFPAERLDAGHLFVVSCASMIDNGLSGLPVHVGLGLLDGAASLIGSYRPGATLPHESLLHYSLLRAGYDVVERCYLLNRNSHANDVMAYPYVPFGHPDSGLDGSAAATDAAVERSTDGLHVTVSPDDAFIVDVTVPLSAFEGEPERAYVRDRTPDATPGTLYYAAFREGDAMRLLLFTGSRLSADELAVTVTETPAADATRRKYRDAYRNAERNVNLGILDGKAQRQTAALRDQIRNLPESVAAERYEADGHERVPELIAEFEGNVDAIHRELVSAALDGEYFQNAYRSRAIDDDVFAADADCFTCGRPVLMKQISDGDRTHRVMGVCPQHGHVFDVPTTPGETSPNHPVVSGELEATGKRFREFTVAFENQEPHPVDATFAPCLRHEGNATDDGESFFDPATVTTEIGPGERANATFTFDSDLVDDNQHYLLARVVANNAVYSGNAVMLVGDRTGFLQPWYRP